jgi:HEAT repeat protein
MVVTMEQVKSIINSTEPNYEEGARLGPDALPHIETIIKTADPVLASKAAYFASFIDDEKSINTLNLAAQSNDSKVRMAAAVGSGRLKNKEKTKIILDKLRTDQDISIRTKASKYLSDIDSNQ